MAGHKSVLFLSSTTKLKIGFVSKFCSFLNWVVGMLQKTIRIYSDLRPFQDLHETFLGLQRSSFFGPDILFPIFVPSRFYFFCFQTPFFPSHFLILLADLNLTNRFLSSFHISLHEPVFISIFVLVLS